MKHSATRRPTAAAENDVLRELFETSPESLVVLDAPRGAVVEANRTFLALTGHTATDVRGRLLVDLGIFEPRDTANILEAAAHPENADFDPLPVRTADGRQAPCRVLLRSCHSGGRRYVQLRINDARSRARRVDEVSRLNEILERRVAERTAELEQTNRELEAFSYSVSHDLRTPLRHVLGFADLLRRQTGPELQPGQLRHLDSITAAGERMNQLIDDLLAFSRIGRAELRKRTVDLTGLVQAARQDLAGETAGRVIEWAVHPLPAVQADPSLLRQAMVNLVSNALKFTASRGAARIEIGSSSIDPGKTVIYVRDNGVGFDPRYAGKLFGVFQRLHNGRDFGGTGIGLANVRQIIRRHGGRVWAEGKPGEGATFYFSLPRPERTPGA